MPRGTPGAPNGGIPGGGLIIPGNEGGGVFIGGGIEISVGAPLGTPPGTPPFTPPGTLPDSFPALNAQGPWRRT